MVFQGEECLDGGKNNRRAAMDDFSPSDLKTILHSKRANLYYLQQVALAMRVTPASPSILLKVSIP